MVGRIILLECAVRLSTYEGDDSEHAFKTMKKRINYLNNLVYINEII